MANRSVKLVAIFGIIFLEAVALWRGVDGIYFSAAVAGIAGIAGYTVGRAKK